MFSEKRIFGPIDEWTKKMSLPSLMNDYVSNNYIKKYIVDRNEDDILIKIPLPAISKEELNIKRENNYLYVSCKPSKENSDIYTSDIEYSFNLDGIDIDEDNIKPTLSNGLLLISLKKKKRKSIDILVE